MADLKVGLILDLYRSVGDFNSIMEALHQVWKCLTFNVFVEDTFDAMLVIKDDPHLKSPES